MHACGRCPFRYWEKCRLPERVSGGLLLGLGFLEDPHDVAFLHDEVLDAIDLDLGARPLPKQDPVADLHVKRHQFARLVTATGPYGDDFALRRFFPGGVRDDDAAGALLLGIYALDDDAVVKRTKLHAALLKILMIDRFSERRARQARRPRPSKRDLGRNASVHKRGTKKI